MANDEDVLARLAFDDEVYALEYSSSSELAAVGTSQAVHVVRVTTPAYKATVASSFRLASRVTALAWGRASFNDGSSYHFRLVAACADRTLRLLSHDTSFTGPPNVTSLGPPGRAPFTTVAWIPTGAGSAANLVASGSSDGSVVLWNLDGAPGEPPRPTASVIAKLGVPVRTVAFHKAQAGLILVHDAAGSIRLIDWTKEGRPVVLHLFDPAAITNPADDVSLGHAAWMPKDPTVFGSLHQGRWAVWDGRTTSGGTPARTGDAWTNESQGSMFRWCPGNPGLFAIATSTPSATTGMIKVYRLASPDFPMPVKLPSHNGRLRSRVHAIAWQPEGDPVLCVAVSRELVWLRVGGGGADP